MYKNVNFIKKAQKHNHGDINHGDIKQNATVIVHATHYLDLKHIPIKFSLRFLIQLLNYGAYKNNFKK